jgi:hypothetical protein
VTKKEKKIQEVLDVFDGVERLSDDDVCHGQLHQLPPTGHLRSNALPLPCPHGCDQTQNPVEKKHIEDHSSLSLWVGSVSQIRRNLVRLLELRARFRLLSFLMKGQCKIIVRFRIAWLEVNRFCKLRLSFGVSASL